MNAENELSQLVSDVLTEQCTGELVEASEGGWSPELWQQFTELGLTSVGIAEEAGGSGGDLLDVATIIRTAARFAAPLPLGHTILVAPHVRSRFSLPHLDGPTAVAIDGDLRAEKHGAEWHISGSVAEIPYGRVVDNVILLASREDSLVAVQVPAAGIAWKHAENLAGEPRDAAEIDVRIEGAALPIAEEVEVLADIRDVEALALTWAMVGAMERVLSLSVNYTTEREQFGRAIAKFQAVKQLAAKVAGEVAVSTAAVETATDLISRGERAGFPIAAARLRAAMAVAEVSQAAHQLHGAIGYTREYPLHQYTRRLWAWRDEGLTERQWMTVAGERALADGPNNVWETLAV